MAVVSIFHRSSLASVGFCAGAESLVAGMRKRSRSRVGLPERPKEEVVAMMTLCYGHIMRIIGIVFKISSWGTPTRVKDTVYIFTRETHSDCGIAKFYTNCELQVDLQDIYHGGS